MAAEHQSWKLTDDERVERIKANIIKFIRGDSGASTTDSTMETVSDTAADTQPDLNAENRPEPA